MDKVTISVTSGNGGDGRISFRHEKYVPDGGPDGGDGGRGGDVVLVSDETLTSLSSFRYKRKFAALSGQPGGQYNRSGASAGDTEIGVPVGTLVTDTQSGETLFDFTSPDQRYIAAFGGRGGKGNQNFATATRQAPNFAKPGEDGETRTLTLELKTIADVGLVGMPNAGKSTMLSRLTNAKPKIADYRFTTLSPNLGMAYFRNEQFVVADVPGLIEGASQGKGLGLDFLRHVERTRLLVHVIDASGFEGRDPWDDFTAINRELESYSEALASRPVIIALNKADAAVRSDAAALLERFRGLGYETHLISAVTGEGMEELKSACALALSRIPKRPEPASPEAQTRPARVTDDSYEIRLEDGVYFLTGEMPRMLLRTVNLGDYESRSYFQRVLKNKGVFEELERLGAKDGDVLDVFGRQFEYYS